MSDALSNGQSELAHSTNGNPRNDHARLAGDIAASRNTWSNTRRKFAVVGLALALIGGGFVAFEEMALGQQQKPRAPAAAPVPATPVPAPAAASAAVSAPAAPEKLNDTAPAWTVGCFSSARAAAPNCKVEQRLFIKETGRALSNAMVDIPGTTRQPLLLLHLPNSLALQDGVSLSIDGGTATPLLWQSCDGNGCYATLVLTPALLETMKKGKVMAVRAVASNREALMFQHLLTDFGPALEAAQ